MTHLRVLAVRLLLLGAGGLLLSYVMALIALTLHGSESPWSEALILNATMGYGVLSDMSAWAAAPPILVCGVSFLAVQAGVLLGIGALLVEGARRTGSARSD